MMILSRRSSRMACLLALLLLLTPYIMTTTLAQDEPPPGEEEPSPSPSPVPTTDEPALPTSPVTPPPSPPPPPSTTSTPTPTAPKMPDPIFSTSDSCTECKPEWPTLQGCLTYLPPNSVNLTVITSVLPFFNCICKDNMAPIDSLSTCSTCLRGTGQLAFLHPMFYNVTPADTKAYKQACADTKGGTVVPPDSAAAAGVGTGAWVMTIAVVAMGGAFLF